LVIARHRLQAVVDWVQLVFTATSFRQGARLLQTSTLRHKSIYCGQIAGQKQQPQSRVALSNTISATEDVIIILYQSGDDRLIFTASNISEDAVLWQRPFGSQAPANPHLTFYPPRGPSCCCSAARIISTFHTPRFEEREREPNCNSTGFRIRNDASTSHYGVRPWVMSLRLAILRYGFELHCPCLPCPCVILPAVA
jgi:hypothetical protein